MNSSNSTLHTQGSNSDHLVLPSHHPAIPRGWTFGGPEDNYIPRDFFFPAASIQAILSSVPDTHTDVITAELNAIPALIKMNGAHPDQNDATVEYAYIDCQKDQLWFIVRFWAGAEMGHYFDLLHPIIQRREVIKPPRDLTILQLWGGGWRELITLEKASEQAGLLQSLLANPPPQPNGRGPTLEERYVVHPGTQLRFFKGTNLVAELVVPMLKPRTVPFVHTVSPI